MHPPARHPRLQDRCFTPSGQVYSDQRSFQDASPATLSAVQAACGALMARARLHPEQRAARAAPAGAGGRHRGAVHAGPRPAQCPGPDDEERRTRRATDSGCTAAEIPAGGKLSPGFQEAARACQRQISAEIRASTLSSLAGDG